MHPERNLSSLWAQQQKQREQDIIKAINSDDLQHILFNVKTSKEMGIISLILPARKLHEHTNEPWITQKNRNTYAGQSVS